MTADSTPIERIVCWPDDALDTTGWKISGPYVELFWLPKLGPSAALILRRCTYDHQFTRNELAFELGVNVKIVSRAIERLCSTGIAMYDQTDHTLYVRQYLWTVPHAQRAKWPRRLREMHARYVAVNSRYRPGVGEAAAADASTG